MFLNCCLTEVVFGIPSPAGKVQTSISHKTDCKSLYEKGTLLDVRAIRQSMPAWNMRWVLANMQKADSTTKDPPGLREDFTKWMRQPMVQFRE